ncbi:hypothetical protein ABPG72_005855 [Tetrahymena utriculariae]
MSFKVKISSKTWIKDNYNLFDYDLEKDLNLKEHTIKNEGILSRKQDDTFFYSKNKKSGQQNDISQMTSEDRKLLQLKYQDNLVKVYPPEEKDQLLWKVAPRSDSEPIIVDLNDTIKIGKKQFTILQINLSNNKQMLEIENHYHISNIMNTFISDEDMMNSSATSHGNSRVGSQEHNQIEKQLEKKERMPCRICLSSSCSRKNPLLAPCNCKGSTRWIHYDCVQQWINQRIQIIEKPNYANIKSRCIKCELCMTLLPPTIKLDDQVYNLYQFKNLKFDKFIVLEDADGLIYMLNFTNKQYFNIGRGHNCDIKLSEITVSRKHLKLEIDKDNKIKLYDINSKFGTLVLVKKPITVQYDQNLDLQNGRTHIRIKRIQKKSRLIQFFNFCYCRKEEIDYPSKPVQKQLKQEIYKERDFEANQEEEAQVQISRVIDDSQQFQSPYVVYNFSQQNNINIPQEQQADISQNTINIRANTQVIQDSQQRSQSVLFGSRRQLSPFQQNQQSQLRQFVSQPNSSLGNYIEVDEELQNRNQINIQQLSTQQHQSQPLLMPLMIHQESVNEQMREEELEDQEVQYNSFSRAIRGHQNQGSIPIIIPHSNSAPTNVDFMPPPIGFR